MADLVSPDSITDLTRLVLANVIHFKAAWRTAFEERATIIRPLHLLGDSERRGTMMREQSNLRYIGGDGYQAV